MISSGNKNQFPSSFAPLGDLLKSLMFLSNLNGFNSFLSPPDQGFAKQKGSSKVWKEKGSKWFNHFFSPPLFLVMQYLCVLLSYLSQSSFYALLCLTCFYLFVFSFALFCFSKKKKFEKSENYKNNVFYVHWYLCILDGPWKKVFSTLYLL